MSEGGCYGLGEVGWEGSMEGEVISLLGLFIIYYVALH